MRQERRNIAARAAVVRNLINRLARYPDQGIQMDEYARQEGLAPGAIDRMATRLVTSGFAEVAGRILRVSIDQREGRRTIRWYEEAEAEPEPTRGDTAKPEGSAP